VGDGVLSKTVPHVATTSVLPAISFDDVTITRRMADERIPSPTVRPLRKVQRSSPDQIKVGRATDNDLIVLDESVSKFHAYFERNSARARAAAARRRLDQRHLGR
jgi:hypothetical protein